MTLFISCSSHQSGQTRPFTAVNKNFRYPGRSFSVKAGVNLIISPASCSSGSFGDTAAAYFENRTDRHHCLAPNHFQQENPAPLFEFEKNKGGGCTTHPDLEGHQVMAQKLLSFLRNQTTKQSL